MSSKVPGRILVTGGAGFIGCHAAAMFKTIGSEVLCLDNLSRRGSETNADWLMQDHKIGLVKADIRNADAMVKVVRHFRPDMILHAAGQVAVTTSVVDPRKDFEENLLGTFNMLEAARALGTNPLFLYTSTNKVYGGMDHVKVVLKDGRWSYEGLDTGASEDTPLDFHSPYGCSKGGADQYVRDYARIYDLPSVVFRQSCIYGARQFGVEDQGWVAWFTIRALQQRPLTIYGDGRQVRDVLCVDDLVEAFRLAWEKRSEVAGEVFNMGGGVSNTMSLLELVGLLEKLSGRPVEHSFADWRPGDQKVFVADVRKAVQRLGWKPVVTPENGVQRLHAWVQDNLEMVEHELNKALYVKVAA